MTRPTPRSLLMVGTTVVAVACAASVLVACGSDPMQRTEERYCTEVGNHLTDLATPVLATDGDIDRIIDAWRTVSRSAPVAVQAEWETVVEAMETAATVDPTDPTSLQNAADVARASEPAANLILTYTLSKCGATIGVDPAGP